MASLTLWGHLEGGEGVSVGMGTGTSPPEGHLEDITGKEVEIQGYLKPQGCLKDICIGTWNRHPKGT